MNPNDVIHALDVIERRFSRILHDGAKLSLQQAKEEVRISYQRYLRETRRRGNNIPPWGFSIPSDRPLEFVSTSYRNLNVIVDLFCTMKWSNEGQPACQQDIVLRVWCNDHNVIFREQIDAEEIIDKLDDRKGRVMLRYHFDLANPGQPGPTFHLQAGGNARDDEACWLHEAVSIPRLPFPPYDLVLACEMVIANFFLNRASTLLNDPNWMGVLKVSQNSLLTSYYENCIRTISRDESLLRTLSNNAW